MRQKSGMMFLRKDKRIKKTEYCF